MEKKDPGGKLKKLGILALNFILIFAAFRLLITLGERFQAVWLYYAVTILYGAAAVGLFVAYFILNGATFENRDRSLEELPARWTEEKKAEFLEKQPERRRRAKTLLYVLLPLVMTLLISYIELSFFS